MFARILWLKIRGIFYFHFLAKQIEKWWYSSSYFWRLFFVFFIYCNAVVNLLFYKKRNYNFPCIFVGPFWNFVNVWYFSRPVSCSDENSNFQIFFYKPKWNTVVLYFCFMLGNEHYEKISKKSKIRVFLKKQNLPNGWQKQ